MRFEERGALWSRILSRQLLQTACGTAIWLCVTGIAEAACTAETIDYSSGPYHEYHEAYCSTREEAYSACAAAVARHAYTADYCQLGGSQPQVGAGWLWNQRDVQITPFHLYSFYIDPLMADPPSLNRLGPCEQVCGAQVGD